jgi:surface protein
MSNMNNILLNNIGLDGGVIIKKGGGGVTINNQEKSVDITENGTTEVVADAGFTGLGKVIVNTNVASSGGGDTPSRPTYTGHADAEGLRAIGWTDEDIAYYQANGVNWNEEDDEYHKVSDDNKALYGVLTANNISTYKDRIVYLPKIDTSAVTTMSYMFSGCYSLVSIPHLDTANVTNMSQMFNSCYSLVSIPHLDTQNVMDMSQMFNSCSSLVSIPHLDTQNVTNMSQMFNNCYSLVSIPHLDTANVTNMGGMFYNCYSLTTIPQLNTANVTNMGSMFNSCYSLVSIPQLDTAKVTRMGSMFNNCSSLTHAHLKNAKLAYDLSTANLLSKESLLYLINNEAATSAITIKLASYAYTRLATDADVVAALAAHPNISLAK